MAHFLTGDMTMVSASNQPPNEDIRNALQILADVAARPAFKKSGTRATLIAYGEIVNIRKLLGHALEQLEDQPDASAQHNANEVAAIKRGDFMRPMGVPEIQCPDCGKRGEGRGHQDCQFPSDLR